MWELGCTFLKEIITGLHTSATSGIERTFAIKHFNRQNKTVTNFCGPVMVQILGRAKIFLECSPVSYEDRQEVAWFQHPRLPAGGGHWKPSGKAYCLSEWKYTLEKTSTLVIICKPKIFLKAWHPSWSLGSHWFICVQIFWAEASHHFKLVSSNYVICYYVNERSHLKTNTRKFLQKMSDSKSPQAACTLSSNRQK